MIIYHGSSEIIKNPHFMGGDDYNDYGNGFYTTNEEDLAREWSVRPNKDGYLNIYELNTNGLKFVDLNKCYYTAFNWMALLYKNRQIIGLERHKQRIERFIENFLPDMHEADAVIGYRADDRYFRFGKLFIRNDLPLKDLEDALLLGNLGQQIFLRSERSFRPDRLKFLGYKRVASIDWYSAKERRENNANKAFEKIENRPRTKDAVTIEDVLDGDGWKHARPADTLYNNKIIIPDDVTVIKAHYCFERQISVEMQSESINLDQRIARVIDENKHVLDVWVDRRIIGNRDVLTHVLVLDLDDGRLSDVVFLDHDDSPNIVDVCYPCDEPFTRGRSELLSFIADRIAQVLNHEINAEHSTDQPPPEPKHKRIFHR